MPLRPLSRADLAALHELAVLADADGFRFVTRLCDDLTLDGVQVDARCEFFVASLEARAASCYAYLRLRTDTASAAYFYERLEYMCLESASATHERSLSGGRGVPATGLGKTSRRELALAESTLVV